MMQAIPEDKRLSRAELIRIGNSYFTGLDTDNSGANVPFDPKCQRRENGIVTSNNPDAEKGSMAWMGCKSRFDSGFSVIVDVHVLVDAAVDGFCGRRLPLRGPHWQSLQHGIRPVRVRKKNLKGVS